MIYVHPGAEPFFLNGTPDKAILFLHGLTGSPSEVYPTALQLNQQYGYTLSGPLLPGHGSHPRFLNCMVWQEWFAAVEAEVAFLAEKYNRVWVAGLSMGGLLALHAARQISGLRGAISLNAPFYPRGSILMGMTSVVKMVIPYQRKANSEKVQALAARGRFTYDVMPVNAFESMMDLRNTVKAEAGEISIPVLIMQGAKDEVVWPKSGQRLAQLIPCSKLICLEESEHIATMGTEIDLITKAINDFAK
ncbi:MAG: alpha/beta hydrolase [Deltaproteobacteria bacterium]